MAKHGQICGAWELTYLYKLIFKKSNKNFNLLYFHEVTLHLSPPHGLLKKLNVKNNVQNILRNTSGFKIDIGNSRTSCS